MTHSVPGPSTVIEDLCPFNSSQVLRQWASSEFNNGEQREQAKAAPMLTTMAERDSSLA